MATMIQKSSVPENPRSVSQALTADSAWLSSLACERTQTTIQTFLETQGLKVGIINGDSGGRNQDTIGRFR